MKKYLEQVKKDLDSFTRIDFPIEEIAKLLPFVTKKEYTKNEYFLKAGEYVRTTCYVINGLFRLFYVDSTGKEYTKNFKSNGQFMSSQAALLLNAPSKLSIQSLEDSEILNIEYSKILSLAESSYYWQLLLRKSAEIDYLEKEKRESDLLFYDAKTRYLNFLTEHPDWDKKIKLRHIASYLGISAETLSRIRANLNAHN